MAHLPSMFIGTKIRIRVTHDEIFAKKGHLWKSRERATRGRHSPLARYTMPRWNHRQEECSFCGCKRSSWELQSVPRRQGFPEHNEILRRSENRRACLRCCARHWVQGVPIQRSDIKHDNTRDQLWSRDPCTHPRCAIPALPAEELTESDILRELSKEDYREYLAAVPQNQKLFIGAECIHPEMAWDEPVPGEQTTEDATAVPALRAWEGEDYLDHYFREMYPDLQAEHW